MARRQATPGYRISCSTSLTFFYKFIFPGACWGFYFTGLYFTLKQGPGPRFHPAQVLLISFVLILLTVFFGTIKKVKLSRDDLIVSNYFWSEKIPLMRLEKVGLRAFPPGKVYVRFREDTSFGRTISFMPYFRLRLFRHVHPVFEILADAIRKQPSN